MSTVDLNARRAETLRIMQEVQQPSFGGMASGADISKVIGLRYTLQKSVGDGVVSEIDLLNVSSMMAELGKAAAVTYAKETAPEAEIRAEIAEFWATAGQLIASKPGDPKPVATPEQLAEELAKVTPEAVAHHRLNAHIKASACITQVGMLAALHGAIEAQLAAQPAYVSAMQYVKDNAERLGVNSAVRKARSVAEQVVEQASPENLKTVAGKAREAIETKLGEWFGR